MVFFDANKFEVNIEFDAPGIFVVGGSISGRVLLHCSEPASVRGLKMSYLVKAHAHMIPDTQLQLTGVAGLAAKLEKDADELNIPVHKVSYMLLGSSETGTVNITPGRYAYPFVIPVPPTMPGSVPGCSMGSVRTCCTCCCDSCGRFGFFGAVVHFLSVKVIIPYSFDKKAEWPVTVLQPIHPAAISSSGPPQVQWRVQATPYDCATCCPCFPNCGLFRSMQREGVDVSIVLPRQSYAWDTDPGIPFQIAGKSDVDFEVILVRTIAACRRTQHVPMRAVIAAVPVAAFGEGTLAGLIPLQGTARAGNVPSGPLGGDDFDVAYTVELRYKEGRDQTCCAAFRERDQAGATVTIGQCVHPCARNPLAFAAAPVAVAGGAFGSFPPPMAPQQPGFYPVASSAGGMTYAYVPPPGVRDFTPAAPVDSSLPPATWGIPIGMAPYPPTQEQQPPSTYAPYPPATGAGPAGYPPHQASSFAAADPAGGPLKL